MGPKLHSWWVRGDDVVSVVILKLLSAAHPELASLAQGGGDLPEEHLGMQPVSVERVQAQVQQTPPQVAGLALSQRPVAEHLLGAEIGVGGDRIRESLVDGAERRSGAAPSRPVASIRRRGKSKLE